MSETMVIRAPEPAGAPVRATVPALEISALSIALRSAGAEKPLVTNVTLSVGSGEIVGLVGESGSGKSLTALASIGLLPHGVEVRSGTSAWMASPCSGWTVSAFARCAAVRSA
jgi:ABC-type glutathione transport system ATPase component